MRWSDIGGIFMSFVFLVLTGCFEEPTPLGTCTEWSVGGLTVSSTVAGDDWQLDYFVSRLAPAVGSLDRRLRVEHSEGAVAPMDEVNVGELVASDPEGAVDEYRVHISALSDDHESLPAGTYSATLSLEGYPLCADATAPQADTEVFEVTSTCDGGDLEIVGLIATPGPTLQEATISWSSIYHFMEIDEPETGPFSMNVQVIDRETGEVVATGDFPAASQSSNVEIPHSIQIDELNTVSPPEPGTDFRVQVELDPEEVVPQCDITDGNHIQNDFMFVDLGL